LTQNPLGLSDDAYAALSAFWLTVLCEDLVFTTPSRIHPRLGYALLELEVAGLIVKEVDGETWTYRMRRYMDVGSIKPMSQKRQRELAIPITND